MVENKSLISGSTIGNMQRDRETMHNGKTIEIF